MQNDGNKSAHLLRAGAVQSRRAPLRSALGLPNTGSDSAHLLAARAVKPRHAPPRSALGLTNSGNDSAHLLRAWLLSLSALRSGARSAYPALVMTQCAC